MDRTCGNCKNSINLPGYGGAVGVCPINWRQDIREDLPLFDGLLLGRPTDCEDWKPRTDSLEQVFKDLESDINLALELALSHIPDDDPDSEWAEIAGILTYAGTSKDRSAEQRLRDCGIEVE